MARRRIDYRITITRWDDDSVTYRTGAGFDWQDAADLCDVVEQIYDELNDPIGTAARRRT